MTRVAIRKVIYREVNGEKEECFVDKGTAKNLAQYNNIYDSVKHFIITEQDNLESKIPGCVRKMYLAESPNMRIRAFKDYIPGVPEDILDHAHYTATVTNVRTNDLKILYGYVPMLYYKLFEERKR